MVQGRNTQKILAKLLVCLMLLTNPVVVPVLQAVHAAKQPTEQQQTATTQDSFSQSVADTDIVYTVDKSTNRQAVQSDSGTVDDDSYLSSRPTTKEKAFRFGNSLLSYYLNQGKNHGPQWLKTTSLSFFVGEDFKPIYSLETIQPFGEINECTSLWFWQGRYAHSGDAGTANLGLGWRKLSADKRSLVGYNLFYDYGFQYDLARVGFGGEYFNKQAEYRFNVYHPVSDDRQTNVSYLDTGILYSYIRAVDGLDLEMGTGFSHAQWMKWYLKGYYYDNQHNDDELGYQLRTTMQLAPRFQLELGYRHSNLNHEPYATFQYQLADKPSPSAKDDQKAGDRIDLSYKLLQPVERDNDIKTETYARFAAYTGSIRITVTNSVSAIPIVGARVQAYQNGVAVGSASITDASGNGLISGLTVDTYTVKVTYSSFTADSSPVAVAKNQTTAAAVSLAVQGGSAGITVLNGQAQPVSGASVTATLSTVARAEKSLFDQLLGVQTAYAATSSFSVTVITDANGVANFTNLPPSTYTFTVNHNGYTMKSQGVAIAISDSSNITMILPASGGNIQAVVKDGSGKAISSATVKVLSGTTTVATGTTDSNGVVVLGGIAAGSYTVEASKTGYTSSTLSNINVTDGQTASATAVLSGQTGSVQVLVTFDDGGAGITPSFYVDGSTTAYAGVTGGSGTGNYTLAGLTANVAHAIKVTAANYDSSTATTALSVTPSAAGTVNTDPVTLARQTGSVQVPVTFDDGGTGITPSFYVDGSATAYADVTGGPGTGNYTLAGLTANVAHAIKVTATNYDSSTATTALSVTPPAAGTVNADTVTLTRQTGSINILAKNAFRGTALPTLQMKLTDKADSSSTYTGNTDSSGTASFASLPAGAYDIVLYDTQGTAVGTSSVTVVPNTLSQVNRTFQIVKITTVQISNSGPATTFTVTIAGVQAVTSQAVGSYTTLSFPCTANIYVCYTSMPQCTVSRADGYLAPIKNKAINIDGQSGGKFFIFSNAPDNYTDLELDY